MRDKLDPKQYERARRTLPLTLATLFGVVLLAGCGGSATTAPAARTNPAATAGSNTVPQGSTASAPPDTPAGIEASALAFAKCMRAHGVPNFPDPTPGGGFMFNPAGLDRSAPAYTRAQERCHKLAPHGGLASPRATTQPSAHTLAKLRHIAQCMRKNGVSDFPDPTTSIPPNPVGSGIGLITDYDGAILLFPSTLNMQSPAYQRATKACGALAAKLGSGPHAH